MHDCCFAFVVALTWLLHVQHPLREIYILLEHRHYLIEIHSIKDIESKHM